jgi:signal peptidase I
MLPALANRESVLAVRTKLSWNRLRRGDIVVLQHPVQKNRAYIKRIVGLPNEDLQLKDGLVYLDGGLLEEPYLDGSLSAGRERDREWWLGPDE